MKSLGSEKLMGCFQGLVHAFKYMLIPQHEKVSFKTIEVSFKTIEVI